MGTGKHRDPFKICYTFFSFCELWGRQRPINDCNGDWLRKNLKHLVYNSRIFHIPKYGWNLRGKKQNKTFKKKKVSIRIIHVIKKNLNITRFFFLNNSS